MMWSCSTTTASGMWGGANELPPLFHRAGRLSLSGVRAGVLRGWFGMRVILIDDGMTSQNIENTKDVEE